MGRAQGSTIAALSSPPGGAVRGVLRLSGPRAAQVLAACFRPLADPEGGPPASGVGATRPLAPASDLAVRRALRGRFDDGAGSLPALLLWMPGPRSYTREDVAELHLPGAEPLLAQALARVLALGAEAAAPGEFTRRAFLNGRIDLAQAEGVLELTRATGEAERRAGALLLGGGLSRRVRGLREHLDELRALCEASLDFDEADTGHVPREELLERLAAIERELGAAHAWEVLRQPPRSLPRVVLAGAPNAGKSSLFNALVGAGEALVGEWAGTTRDHLAGAWRLGGPPGSGEPRGSAGAASTAGPEVLLVDTPGADPAARGADAAAQRLAAGELRAADVVLLVVDATGEPPPPPALPAEVPVLLVLAKQDLPGAAAAPGPGTPGASGEWVAVSARTGAGLRALGEAVLRALGQAGGGPVPEGAWAVSRELFARHRRGLDEAALSLERAQRGLAEGPGGAPLDQVAQELRQASRALDAIDGRTSPEDLLDRIFARFCLGK